MEGLVCCATPCAIKIDQALCSSSHWSHTPIQALLYNLA